MKKYILIALIIFWSSSQAQNIGIGTATPGAKLEVAGNSRYWNEIRFANSTAMKGLVWGDVAPSWTNYYTRIDDYGGNLHIMTDDALLFTGINTSTGLPGTTRMTLDMTTGILTLPSLGTGLVKSTGGILSPATAGTDFQAPVVAGTGISISGTTINNTGILNQTSLQSGANYHIGGEGRIQGSLYVSLNNATGGGIELADDGDIVDLNDGFATHRFSYGLRLTNANGAGSTVIQLANGVAGSGFTYFNSGNVGIGTASPGYTLHVNGNSRVGTSTAAVDMGSDGNAYIEMREVDGTGSPFIDFSNDNAIDFDGRLQLTGDDEMSIIGANFRVQSLGSGYVKSSPTGVLSNSTSVPWSDITGAPAFVTAATETDPQVGGNTTNYVPRWDGSALVTGVIQDNGTNVGIGATPTDRLTVNGNVRIGTLTNDDGSVAGWGSQLYFSGGDDWAGWDSDNSDPLYMGRFNTGNNTSDLRLIISDDAQVEDRFTIGNTSNNTMFIFNTLGNFGAGITPAERIHTNGNIRADGIVYWGNGLVRTETRIDAGLQGSNGARSGFFENNGSTLTNYPAMYGQKFGGWVHLIDVRHSNNSNNYAMQLAGSFYDQDLFYRKTNGSPTTGWTRAISNRDISYVKNEGTLFSTTKYNWVNVTGASPWMEVRSGDKIKLDGMYYGRLTGGSANEFWYTRVEIQGQNGCSTTYSNQHDYWHPDEGGGDHDNFKPVPYMDVWESNCTGEVRFLLQVYMGGDDNWEAREMIITGTRY